jgi:hypothetical protein
MEISIGTGPHGHRWAWTEGLSAYNQQDFAVPMPWEEGNWRDEQIRRLLEFLESYMQVQPKRIHADETMRYGWTSLYFRATQHEDGEVRASRLIVCEVAEPLRDVEPQNVDGGRRSARHPTQDASGVRCISPRHKRSGPSAPLDVRNSL